MHRARVLLVAILSVCVPVSTFAKDEWMNEPAYKALLKHEVKVLVGLLRSAVKEDYRRQAWYLADRVVAADPLNTEGAKVLEQWDERELQQGQVPKKAWNRKLASTLKNLGDQYFHFGETLEAAGIDPENYYPINVRAQHYGSVAGPLMSSMRQAGYLWCGTYEHQEESAAQSALGPLFGSVTYPPEHDDEFLKVRALWPAAKVVAAGRWRLITDHAFGEALRFLRIVAEVEEWVVRTMGSSAKKDDTVTEVIVFRNPEDYDRYGEYLIRARDRDEFLRSSGWYSRMRQRAMLPCKHRHNAWVAEDALLLGQVAQVLARRHLSGAAGGRVTGRGAWLLDGFEGALQGLHRNEDGDWALDPTRCWQLGAARALRDDEQLVAWDAFVDLDQKKADDLDRATLQIPVAGALREAKEVDVASAQATALVVGILLSHEKKGPKALAKLMRELFKRDSLPDLDKTLRFKRGQAVDEANRAMDAVVVKD